MPFIGSRSLVPVAKLTRSEDATGAVSLSLEVNAISKSLTFPRPMIITRRLLIKNRLNTGGRSRDHHLVSLVLENDRIISRLISCKFFSNLKAGGASFARSHVCKKAAHNFRALLGINNTPSVRASRKHKWHVYLVW